MTRLPPLECAHRGCHRHARHAVLGQRHFMAACTQHVAAIRARCGEPCQVNPLQGAPAEDDQPDLFTTENGDTP